MKLVVGLGNPGKEYLNTRHNIGFEFLDYYISNKRIDSNWIKKFDGLYIQTLVEKEKVIFLKPQTYMNLSGTSVRKFIDYFNINLDDIIVVSDDMDLFLGNFKIRLGGSSGGHNGLKNIEDNIGTSHFKRLKIGISKDTKKDGKDYVLGKFSKEEQEVLKNLFPILCSVLDDYFSISFEKLMNQYNQKNR